MTTMLDFVQMGAPLGYFDLISLKQRLDWLLGDPIYP